MSAGERGTLRERSLTRRGWWTVGVVVVCLVLGVLFGRRALDAVALPLALAVVAAVVTTRRADAPVVDRRLPDDGHVGETGDVILSFDVSSPTSGTVSDDVDDGLVAENSEQATTITDEPLTYEIKYRQRGIRSVGPLSVEVRDVLGLARARFAYNSVSHLTVYPRVHELRGITRSRLVALAGAAPDREREAFDRIREYEPGDDLRDVHWRSSAKRPGGDLIVKEFLAEEDVDDVHVAVETGPDHEDVAAEVGASLVVHLLSAGLSVKLTTPQGHSGEPVAGLTGRRRLLEQLAVLTPGDLGPGAREAAVHVDARGTDPVVRIADAEISFDALLRGPDDVAVDGTSALDAAAPADDAESRTAADGGHERGGDSGREQDPERPRGSESNSGPEPAPDREVETEHQGGRR